MNVEDIKNFIKQNNIPAEIIDHPQASGRSSLEAAATLGVKITSIIKTLLFVSKNGKAFVIIQGSKTVDSKIIPGLKNPRLATATELKDWFDLEPGAIPPICLPKEVKKIIDDEVLKETFVFGSAGNRFVGLKLNPQIITNEPNTVVMDIGKK